MNAGGSQTVYIKGADGKPQPVKVTIGATDGTMTEITGGDLQPGMQVITGQLAAGAQASGSGAHRSGGSGSSRRSGGGAGGARGGGQRGGQ